MIAEYGRLADRRRVDQVTLRNRHGLVARLISYGARLTELQVPDRAGRLADVVVGHDRLEDYVASGTYFGATCGRYANRIAGGRFDLDGQAVQVDVNEGANHLHGGRDGFDRKIWVIAALSDAEVVFTAHAADGEMGFPGACDLRVSYGLDDDNRLRIVMQAVADRPTVMNIVNHSYFNLAGQGSVLDQVLRVDAAAYTPVDGALLATGEVRAVAGTAFDFRVAKPIGRDFSGLDTKGYDHNWCLNGAGMRDCVVAWDPLSGRRLTLATSEPGLQIYTGGYLDAAMPGKAGRGQCQFGGFTLETQKYPGSPNWPQFPTARIAPGLDYHHAMELRFDTLA